MYTQIMAYYGTGLMGIKPFSTHTIDTPILGAETIDTDKLGAKKRICRHSVLSH